MESGDFVFRDTSSRAEEPGKLGSLKPDISLIRKTDEHLLKHTRKRAGGKKRKFDADQQDGGDHTYAARMELIELVVEVKKAADSDPFTDPPGLEPRDYTSLYSAESDDDPDQEVGEDGDEVGEDRDEVEGNGDDAGGNGDDAGEDGDEVGQEETQDADTTGDEVAEYRFVPDPNARDPRKAAVLGQNASYAETLLTRQFRTCVFSLSVSGRFVRFLRWDREGVIVSEAVDYKANPTPLAAFLLAFTSAPPPRRGWDTSVQPSHDPTDEDLFHAKITEHVMQQLSMKRTDRGLESKVNEHYQKKVITRLFVPSTGSEEPLQILVSRPCSTSHSPTGRSTRGYWGVDVKQTAEESRVVFVKDVWRSDVEGVELEGDILRYLNEEGVTNIPPFIAHGDVKVEGELCASHWIPPSLMLV